jgi:hypothetical protein
MRGANSEYLIPGGSEKLTAIHDSRSRGSSGVQP